jgi:predicted MPP superfamily phosphohydrolase
MLTAALLAHIYVFYRLWNLIPQPFIRAIVMTVVSFCLFTFFGSFFVRDILPPAFAPVLHSIGTGWLICFLYLLLTLLAFDLARLLPFVPANFLRHNGYAAIAIGTIVAVIMTGGYINYRIKKRSEVNITVNKSGGKISDLKIVAISDLHLGDGIGKKEFESWLPLIEKENPDIILIAGDIVDNNLRPLIENDFASSFRKLNAPMGVYAVMGNHDFFGGGEATATFLRDCGLTLLRDTAVMVDSSFYLVGRDDRNNRSRKALPLILKEVNNDKPVILLDHQPSSLQESIDNHIDLQISGHTHNGQVWPLNYVTKSMFEVSYGYAKKGETNIYVSSGIGLWGGKFRIGTRSEYAVINIHFGRQ